MSYVYRRPTDFRTRRGPIWAVFPIVGDPVHFCATATDVFTGGASNTDVFTGGPVAKEVFIGGAVSSQTDCD